MKNTIRSLAIAVALFAANSIHAQTYYLESLGGVSSRIPYPMDPYAGAEPIETINASEHIYLIEDVSDGRFHAMDDSESLNPSDSGGGDGDEEFTFTPQVIDTNGLYLQMNGTSNGMAAVSLMNATDYVYFVESRTSLACGGWNIEQELFPGTQTNALPFEVSTAYRDSLYLRAGDWTGITNGDNQTPTWWLYYWYGTDGLDLTDDTLDGGNPAHTLLWDYQNGIDPNLITFMTTMPKNYVNTTNALAQINLQGGEPFYEAVLVNDTNYADADWQSYTSSNILVNLGTTDGVYNVWIGLRGLPTNAQQTWNTTDVRFYLDRTPPTVVITNPVCSVLTRPYVQLQGFADEPLSHISYDVSNAVEVVTNLQGFVTDQFYDTNSGDFTTNYFQCYDIALTNGLNLITARFTDRAGNMTTTNLSLTLDYSGDTNPPVINLVWPQDGMQISGSNFTLRGTIDDETATVSAQIVDTNGDTNVVSGIVERNGKFWIENLPLTNDANVVTLSAVDAAGNVSTMNITVWESDVGLTISSMPGNVNNGLYQPNGIVTGTVGDASYTIYVNGVEATNNGDGTWEADNVPILGQGTATFDAVAYPGGEESDEVEFDGMAMDDSSSQSINVSAAIEKNPYLVITEYSENKNDHYQAPGIDEVSSWDKNYTAHYDTEGTLQSYQGTVDDYSSDSFSAPNGVSSGWTELDFLWTANSNITHWTDSSGVDITYDYFESGYGNITSVPDQDGWEPPHYSASGIDYHWDYTNSDGSSAGGEDITLSARTKATLYTGGKAIIGKQSLFNLYIGANSYSQPPQTSWFDTPGESVGAASLTVLGAHPGSDGNVWVMEPSGTSPDATVTAPADHYSAGASLQGEYTLTHTCEAYMPTNQDRLTIGVGEKVDFGGMPGNTVWNTSAGTLSATNGGGVILTAPDRKATAVVTATVGSVTQQVSFNVIEPNGVQFVKLGEAHIQGNCDAGFHAQCIILPTNVSFYNIQISEMHGTATATGCWSSLNGEQHPTWTEQGIGWLTPAPNNYLPTSVDYVRIGGPLNGPGTYSLPIPWNYHDYGATNDGFNFTTLTMTATATTNSCTVNKNGMNATFENDAQTVSD